MGQASLKARVAGGEHPMKVPSFPALLERMKPQLAAALPKHITPDRMIRIALTQFRQVPKLQQCEESTILAAIVVAAQLGLEPGVLGQAYLIPYKRTCTFVPGWQGLVDLVNRTGRASTWTGAVYRDEPFKYSYGTTPFIEHVPSGEDDPRRLTHVYAVGRVRGSEFPNIEVWPIEKVWRHRDRYNRSAEDHYSYQHPEMYARKVPLLQVIKYLPKSPELVAAVGLEHAATIGTQALDLASALDGSWSIPATTEGGEEPQQPTPTAPTARKKSARSEPRQEDLGGNIPMYDVAAAEKALRACKDKSLEELARVQQEVWADFRDTGRAIPNELHAAWNETREALEDAGQ